MNCSRDLSKTHEERSNYSLIQVSQALRLPNVGAGPVPARTPQTNRQNWDGRGEEDNLDN